VQGADGFYTAVNLIRIPAVSRGTVQGRRAHPYACVHACHACADTARIRKLVGTGPVRLVSGGTGPVRKPPVFLIRGYRSLTVLLTLDTTRSIHVLQVDVD
jgi:hypothetical protein